MLKKKALVTGSSGLIGSEACVHFSRVGYDVLGVVNNQRAIFFRPERDTSWWLRRLKDEIPSYEHVSRDMRDRDHICYYSDIRKMKAHYPGWEITKNLRTAFLEIANAWS